MAYRENVELAAAALIRGEDANWELARLTYENTYDAGDIESQSDRVTMRQWCKDVEAAVPGRKDRFSSGNGLLYKRIWRAYGHYDRNDRPTWTDAAYAVRNESASQAGTRRALSEARNARPELKGQMLTTIASDAAVAPEDKRAAFAALAADPAIVEQAAVVGTAISQAVTRLTHQAKVTREQRHERETEADPIARKMEQQRALLDLEAACNQFAQDCVRFAREITDILPASGEASADELEWIRRAIERGRSALDQLEGYVSTGRTDLDAFLTEVLKG
jgi:Family of unknown function (DUF6192)